MTVLNIHVTEYIIYFPSIILNHNIYPYLFSINVKDMFPTKIVGYEKVHLWKVRI